ncbi:MAG TPA: leucine-rich repeat protein [Clostridiales bacterium]|nr:leucine-rich repeat protein [Clostridiales bacterium]
MKNFSRIITLLIMVVLLCILFVACEPDVYVLTFEPNGGNDIDSIENNGEDEIELPTPQREGYTFGGWYLDAETFNNEYKGEALSESVTVYAKWTINEYTISFETNGGSPVDSISADYGEQITAPNSPEREGYSFEGWFVDSDLGNEFSFDTMPPQDITIYAGWQAIDYNITYNLDGGENNQSNPQTYTIETDSFELLTPTKEHYTFLGWFADSGYDNEITHIGGGETGDITIYAKWVDEVYVDGLTLKYDIDNNFYELISAEEIQNAVIPAQHNNYPIAVIGEGAFEGNTTLESVTIPMSVVYIADMAFKDCSNLTDVNFDNNATFEGWFEDEELTTQYTFTDSLPSEGKTLYAKWQHLNKGIRLNFDPQIFPQHPNHPDIPGGDSNAWGYKFTISNIAKSDMLVLHNYDGYPISKIGNNVFEESGLVNVNLSDTLVEIGACAFMNCDDLVEISLPENIYRMGIQTFKGCGSLEEVYVQTIVSWEVYNYGINMGAFEMFFGCSNLEAIYVHNINNGVVFDLDNPGSGYYIYKTHPGAWWYYYDDHIQPMPPEQ